ncbi:MAG TPA: MG2 domain-containing protein, partial [Caldimonas sp.]|nr:MG2 domain-containing protein [Caldimonas sp.]
MPAAYAASVVAVSPSGEVAKVREVTVKFSEAVVPFGDPRVADPFSIACQGTPPTGAGRWASDRVWLYDFREDLPPGTRCTVKALVDWKPTPKGGASSSSLTGPTEFTFSTGGPAVVSAQPSAGSDIDADAYFLLRLSGPAVESTVGEHAWCEAEGIGERLPVQVVGGDVREQVLKARRIDKARAANMLLVHCTRPLPDDAAARLVWGKGIAAAANPAVVTTIEQRFRYHVRPAFTADFTCERENASAPCLPIRPMSVRFSAPVARALAAQVQLVPAAGGAALAPVFDKDDKSTEVSEIAFPKPLAENAAYRIVMPPGLHDDAGRALANAASFPLKVATGAAPPIAKFAAAPFGIIERDADAALPVTLRHVQVDLGSGNPAAGASPAGSTGRIRDKLLTSDSDILSWYALVQKYHETELSARELGFPQSTWSTTEEVTDAKGRTSRRKVDRMVGTREVSLLAREPDVRSLTLPQLGAGDARPFEVIGIPLPQPGYHVVEIESLRLGQSLLDKRAPMFVRTGVLVTNLGVHFKLGRENSLVWVTSLDRGKPVEGADVAVNDCFGKPLWNGRTDAKGLAVVARALDASFDHCPADGGYFVTAHRRGDVAFVFSTWQKGIESWRFNVPTARGAEPDLRASTVFDRTLFRAGETVSMKHFIRVETSRGLAQVAADRLPTRVKIVHEGSGQEFVFPLQWLAGGRSATTTWKIPPAAKLGVYDVSLEREGGGGGGDETHSRSSG